MQYKAYVERTVTWEFTLSADNQEEAIARAKTLADNSPPGETSYEEITVKEEK